jgi:hypothetical protein
LPKPKLVQAWTAWRRHEVRKEVATTGWDLYVFE